MACEIVLAAAAVVIASSLLSWVVLVIVALTRGAWTYWLYAPFAVNRSEERRDGGSLSVHQQSRGKEILDVPNCPRFRVLFVNRGGVALGQPSSDLREV